MGCNLDTEESKDSGLNKEIVNKPKAQSGHPERSINIFKQDINKSYILINRPWVLAKPLGIDSEANVSDFFDE